MNSVQVVDTVEQVTSAVERIKVEAVRFTTNWFVAPGQIQTWIGRRALSYVAFGHSLLIFRRDRDFYHIYHAASEYASLASALSGLRSMALSNVIIAADLVGRANEVDALANVYCDGGFRHYQLLYRMLRLADDHRSNGYYDPEVVFAGNNDAPDVHAFFEELLDPLVDQAPELDAVCTASEQRKILVIRHDNRLAGVLLFETAGLTATVRYWYSRPALRDRGIGGRLMKTFFHLCRSSKRIILWVVKNNADAIAKYQHYGFREEGLVDRIMITNLGSLR